MNGAAGMFNVPVLEPLQPCIDIQSATLEVSNLAGRGRWASMEDKRKTPVGGQHSFFINNKMHQLC